RPLVGCSYSLRLFIASRSGTRHLQRVRPQRLRHDSAYRPPRWTHDQFTPVMLATLILFFWRVPDTRTFLPARACVARIAVTAIAIIRALLTRVDRYWRRCAGSVSATGRS